MQKTSPPWPLELAHQFFDRNNARLLMWPRNPDEGWMGQDEWELLWMRVAWYIEYLFKHPDKRTADDATFLLWLDPEFDKDDDDEHTVFWTGWDFLSDG